MAAGFVALALFALLRAGPAVNAAPVGIIQITIDCGAKLERMTIANLTNEELLLTGWTLGTLVKPRGNEPFALSGKLAPGAQVTYETGPDAIPGRLTLAEVKIFDAEDPLEAAILETPYGTAKATCLGRLGLVRVGPPPSAETATPTATAIIPAVVPTTAPTQTALTSQANQPFAWLDRPPLGANSTRSCPSTGQWFLVYSGGPDGTPISTAAAACQNADVFWASRGGKWFGYAKSSPDASDIWNVGIGEAHFARGQ
jgi:hypothetical protein